MPLDLDRLIEATGGRLVGPTPMAPLAVAVTDGRQATSGSLFFALKGATADGHDFVGQAVAKGCSAVVASRPVADVDLSAVSVIMVEDTWQALFAVARDRLAAARPRVVGITGSTGKTSTKELTAAALGRFFGVLATAGNLNTQTGVPLTLMQLEPGLHQVAVLEMGLQVAGDIGLLARLASPEVGVITNIGVAHMESLGSVQAIVEAKAELLSELPSTGWAVLNRDDPHFDKLRRSTAARLLTFGGTPEADLRLVAGPHHYWVVVAGVAQPLPLRLSVLGRHQALNAVAALAVARVLGLDLLTAAGALGGVRLSQRLQVVELGGGRTLVDDSYNASPDSVLAAFETVTAEFAGRPLVVVLGDMLELGPVALEAHRQMGAWAARFADRLAVTGAMADLVADAAVACGLDPDRVLSSPSLATVVEWLVSTGSPGDVILVKASRGIGLDRLVADLKARWR